MSPASPARILIVLRRLGMGGIERATLTLANALARQGHDVHLQVLKGIPEQHPDPTVTLHCRDFEQESRRTPLGMAYHLLSRLVFRLVLPGSAFLWQGRVVSRRFQRHLQQLEAAPGQRFDLILIRGQGAFELLWQFNDSRSWLVVEAVTGRLKYHWLTRKLYDGKKAVCVSEGVTEALTNHLAEQGARLTGIDIIHNAVPVERIRELARADVSPRIEPPFLVHVARLVPVKQQTLLLEAYQRARQCGLEHALVIIGDGSQRQSLEALAQRLGIDSQVHFLGQQANPYPWVAQADAFVLSSRFEGLGLVLIEALALGTPCVATQAPGGIGEVLVGDQQRLLAAQTADDLAAKILEAVERPPAIDPAWIAPFTEARITQRFLELLPRQEVAP